MRSILLAAVLGTGLCAQGASFKAVNLSASKGDPMAGRGIVMFGMGPGGGNLTAGRAVFQDVTLVQLIEAAYGLDRDERVLGGPTWIGSDHFDLHATADPTTSDPQMQAMLQALLAERFGLKVHADTRNFPGFALVAGKGKSKLKNSAGGEPGCRQQFAQNGPAPGGGDKAQVVTALDLSSMTFHVTCTNLTMGMFVSQFLQNMLSTSAQNNPPVLDQTGLTDHYDFEMQFAGDLIIGRQAGTDALAREVENQTGLGLEKRQVPMSVEVVESANESLAAGTAPPLPPPPAEFEVVSIKAFNTGGANQVMAARGDMVMMVGGRGGGPLPTVTPGGEVTWNAASLQQMILFAYNQTPDRLVGAPAFLNQDRWVISARTAPGLIPSDLTGMMQKLLETRFQLKAHNDNQPVDTYLMTPSGRKVTLKPSTADERSACKRDADGSGVQILICTATTMAQLADQLPNTAPAYFQQHHAADLTGIGGSYDFTLRWAAAGLVSGAGGGSNPGEAATPVQIATTDSIFQTVEKTLGVKIAMGKATLPVLVIDSVDKTPSEN